MSQKNVYALLVGVNAYKPPVPRLKGCVADIEAVLAYLKAMPGIRLHESVLLDENATKARIVGQFLSHLGQAGPDDVALFYFCGHGTREAANPVFWNVSPSRALQCLVPYNEIIAPSPPRPLPPSQLLADKELRYLIHQISKKQPHIITIFDCCHSGQNTRSGTEEVMARRIDGVLPERNWEDFIFGKKIQPADFEKRPISELLPEGRHIQIAAALPTESAYERNGHGVFTQMLLEVLQRSDNRVTYYDLQSRIRQYVKNNFKQTPQVYASEEADSELFRFFLDLEAAAGAPLYGNVYERDNSWFIDLGHLQGISAQAHTAKVVAADGVEYTAQLGKIQSSETQLLFEQKLPSGTLYKGYIDGFLSSPIKVFLAPATGFAPVAQLLHDQWSAGGANIHEASAEYEADYAVRVDQRGYVITPGEKPHRPLVAAVKEPSVSGAKIVMLYLRHIAQWEFVKNLHNPNSFLFKKFPVEIEFYQVGADGKDRRLELHNDVVNPVFDPAVNGGSIKIRLVNKYDKPLFVSLIYLSMRFQVFSGFLPQGIVELQPNADCWIRDGKPVKLTLEEEVLHFKDAESVTYLKLIASTHFVDVKRFDQVELPSPLEGPDRAGRETSDYDPDASDWVTRLVTVSISNPQLKE
jgi:hypothetical protein